MRALFKNFAERIKTHDGGIYLDVAAYFLLTFFCDDIDKALGNYLFDKGIFRNTGC